MILANGRVFDSDFTFKNHDVYTCNSKLCSEPQGETLDCNDCFVIPGLIDIHTHGALGHDHLDGKIENEEIISNFMLQHGVTSYLAAVMTESHEKMSKALTNIYTYTGQKHKGAKIVGVYLEGPYFSQEYKGAQNPKYIRTPSIEEFNKFQKISGNCIKVISLAPEVEGAQKFIKNVSSNVTVAIGHTNADYETAMKAIENGATDFTHTFNGMRGLHHRSPNALGAAFDSDTYCECICDGLHIHPAVIRTLFKIKSADRIVMISDSISPAGLPDGEYSSGGQSVNVKDGKAYISDGVLAGSTTFLLQGIKNVVSFGIPLTDAIKTATANPAKVAGIFDEVGSLESGKNADILVLNKNLDIVHIILNGEIII